MNPMEDLAGIDRSYRCIMKEPSKKYVLRSFPCRIYFFYGVADGMGARRALGAIRRAGGGGALMRFPFAGVSII